MLIVIICCLNSKCVNVLGLFVGFCGWFCAEKKEVQVWVKTRAVEIRFVIVISSNHGNKFFFGMLFRFLHWGNQNLFFHSSTEETKICFVSSAEETKKMFVSSVEEMKKNRFLDEQGNETASWQWWFYWQKRNNTNLGWCFSGFFHLLPWTHAPR